MEACGAHCQHGEPSHLCADKQKACASQASPHLGGGMQDCVLSVCEAQVAGAVLLALHELGLRAGVHVVQVDAVVVAGCGQQVPGAVEGKGIDPGLVVLQLQVQL